ncbi:DUF4238 domain-containing protein [Marinococcus luteus]|uniref:DUF4238 domain-containing protein n=1 Tax=Marinococcus luteus TaxID=1122204 RepID=UPI00350E5891
MQIFFPINKNLCICLYDDVMYEAKNIEDNIIKINKARQMDELNKMVLLNSYQNVFFLIIIVKNI